MSRPRYIVVSASGDGHIPFVEKHLDQPFLVIDPGKILKGTPMSYRFHEGQFEAFYNRVPLKNARSVWYRKPELAMPSREPHQGGYEEFTRHAMSLFMRQFYGLLPNTLWISNYYALIRSSDKLHQLSVASRLGFRIPDTLVTASEKDAIAFAGKHKDSVVKPIEVKVFTLNDKQHMMFTKRVRTDNPKFPGLHLAPAIIQEAINEAKDVRVTVAGEKAFAAIITAKEDGLLPRGIRDWRAGDHYGGTHIAPFELPSRIARLCIQHAKEMGLLYCAIDLLLDKSGTFWFLENNPNGQWAFIEDATGQPIGKEIAEMLMAGGAQ
jgi:glutathione synthase/RimK-type ligase-like ATP-grasp enzyme